MRNIIKIILFLLPLFANAQQDKKCDWLPEERSVAEIPVEVGFTVLPGHQQSLIAQVVNYGTLMERPLPRDPNDPTLHSHIWIIDKVRCKKLVVLPLPINATINVDSTGTHALPITQLADGNLEIKYVFAVPEKIKTIIARKVIINKQWQIVKSEDIEVKVNGDARKAAFIADWHQNEDILHVSEPIGLEKYHHSLVYFSDKQISLYQFTATHPEFEFKYDGIVLDDTKAYNKTTYYPRYFLITAFSPTLKYYRQYTHPQPKPHGKELIYVYFTEGKDQTLIQISDKIINVSGRIIEPVKYRNKMLPDYQGDDALQPSDITSYIWKNGQWIDAPFLRPTHVTAEDLKKIPGVWP